MNKYVIIVGAMKSGTTTLFELLARHPRIAPASNKEPGFFAFDEVWDRGFDWYHSLFDFDPEVHEYRLEASTDYTKYPFVTGVWDRMTANDEASVKLIYLMRHPFRRMESHARHVQINRKEIGQQISPRPDHSLDAGLSQVSLAVSQYATQIDMFRPAMAEGALHLLTLEGLRQDPARELAGIYEFLGLETPETPQDLPTYNAGSNRKALHPLWGKLASARSLMSLGRAVLPERQRRFIKELFRREVKAQGRFRLSAAEERQLNLLFAEELRRLREDYGIDTDQIWDLAP